MTAPRYFAPRGLALCAALVGTGFAAPVALSAQDATANATTETELNLSADITGGDVDAPIPEAADGGSNAFADAAQDVTGTAEEVVERMADTAGIAPEAEGAAVEGQVGVELAELESTEDLIGARVYDINEEWVGEVSAVRTSSASSEMDLIVDVGGFLGLGEKPVEVPAQEITVEFNVQGDVAFLTVDMTMEALEALPEAQM